MTVVTLILGLLAQHIVPVLIGAAGLIGLFFARRSGVKSERAKRAQEELKARTQADEIEDAIAGRTADENRGRLRTWGRR